MKENLHVCHKTHAEGSTKNYNGVRDGYEEKDLVSYGWWCGPCSEKNPKQQAACEIRNGWMPKLKTKKKKKGWTKYRCCCFDFFFLRFTLPFLCKHENRDKSHQDNYRGAGNFKNQGLYTLQNSTLLIFILVWHLSAEERKEAVSEEERKKDQKEWAEERWKSELRSTHWKEGRSGTQEFI